MNLLRITAIIVIPAITLALSSDIIIGEFTNVMMEDNYKSLKIYNDGLFQISDVMVHIKTDETNIEKIDCIEGMIHDNPTRIQFEYMTPGITCTVTKSSDIEVHAVIIIHDAPASTYYDGQINVERTAAFLLAIIIAVQVILVLFLAWLIEKITYIPSITVLRYSSENITPDWGRFCKYIKEYYHIKIQHFDALILYTILYNDLHTVLQICNKTGMSQRYVHDRIIYLQKSDIMINDIIDILEPLQEKFKEFFEKSK